LQSVRFLLAQSREAETQHFRSRRFWSSQHIIDAAHAGFSDQSQFSRHFKRIIGVTPRHFRTPARNAEKPASLHKIPNSDVLTIPREHRGRETA
jgi:AraC-like DNA-binding protein